MEHLPRDRKGCPDLQKVARKFRTGLFRFVSDPLAGGAENQRRVEHQPPLQRRRRHRLRLRRHLEGDGRVRQIRFNEKHRPVELQQCASTKSFGQRHHQTRHESSNLPF